MRRLSLEPPGDREWLDGRVAGRAAARPAVNPARVLSESGRQPAGSAERRDWGFRYAADSRGVGGTVPPACGRGRGTGPGRRVAAVWLAALRLVRGLVAVIQNTAGRPR